MSLTIECGSLLLADVLSDQFFGIDEDQRFVVILVALGCTTGIVVALAGMIVGVTNSIHRRWKEHELKREMLDRGMSAEEIATIIEATAKCGQDGD